MTLPLPSGSTRIDDAPGTLARSCCKSPSGCATVTALTIVYFCAFAYSSKRLEQSLSDVKCAPSATVPRTTTELRKLTIRTLGTLIEVRSICARSSMLLLGDRNLVVRRRLALPNEDGGMTRRLAVDDELRGSDREDAGDATVTHSNAARPGVRNRTECPDWTESSETAWAAAGAASDGGDCRSDEHSNEPFLRM